MVEIRPPEGELWLIENKCHACSHRAQCPGNYKVTRTPDGWRCHGFRSRFWDEMAVQRVQEQMGGGAA